LENVTVILPHYRSYIIIPHYYFITPEERTQEHHFASQAPFNETRKGISHSPRPPFKLPAHQRSSHQTHSRRRLSARAGSVSWPGPVIPCLPSHKGSVSEIEATRRDRISPAARQKRTHRTNLCLPLPPHTQPQADCHPSPYRSPY